MVPVDDGPAATAAAKPPPDQAWKAAFCGAFAAIAMVLSVRVLLILTATGGFVLAWRALTYGSVPALIAAAIYEVGVFLPAVVLAMRGR